MREKAEAIYNKLLSKKKSLLQAGKIKKQTSKLLPPNDLKDSFKIPDHWIWAQLGDVSLIQEGPGIRKHQYCNEGIQFLTVTNILEDSIDLTKSIKHISKEEYSSKYSHFKIDKGDIVVACSGASWGKSAIFNEQKTVMLNTSTLRLRFFGDLADNKFLYYFTKTDFFKNQISSHSTGQQPNYGFSHYSIAYVPFPPLPEQKRIVAILDEAFAAIDVARANASRNLANSRELFDSYLNRVFTEKGEGWEETTVGEQIILQRGFDITKKQQRQGTIPVVSSGGIKSHHDTAKIDGPAVILGRKGSVGSVFYIDAKCWPHDTTLWVKDFKDNSPRLAYYMFRGLNLKELDSGAANPALNRNKVHPLPIYWPQKSTNQDVIASQLLAIEIKTKEAVDNYNHKLLLLDELKQAILAKAFSGELSGDTPELKAIP